MICELCGTDVPDGEHYSWHLCDRHGVGVHLCQACAYWCDAMEETRVMRLLRWQPREVEITLMYLLSASPARYVAALKDIGWEDRAEDARQRYRVTHETVERMRKTGGHG